jgi:hypothetical protein
VEIAPFVATKEQTWPAHGGLLPLRQSHAVKCLLAALTRVDRHESRVGLTLVSRHMVHVIHMLHVVSIIFITTVVLLHAFAKSTTFQLTTTCRQHPWQSDMAAENANLGTLWMVLTWEDAGSLLWVGWRGDCWFLRSGCGSRALLRLDLFGHGLDELIVLPEARLGFREFC